MSKFKLPMLYSQRGFVFLEILIAIALVIIAFISMLTMAFSVIQVSTNIKIRNQIDAMLKEELEAARSFRDATTWSTNGLGSLGNNYGSSFPYYFSLDGSTPPKWIINAGTETVGRFTRHVIIDKAMRDSTGSLVAFTPIEKGFFERLFAVQTAQALVCPDWWTGPPPCMFDPDTYKLTARVFYEGKTYEVVTYLTNWKK